MRLNCKECGKKVTTSTKGAQWHQICYWEYKRGRGMKRKKIKDKGGYVLVYSPDHPFKDSRGYMREHRLVMEKSLGRYLKREELIHHVNHVRDDNKIENLKLFGSNGEHMKEEYKLKRWNG